MNLILLVLPLFVIVGILLKQKHMLVASFAGGVAAVLIGRLDVGTINSAFMGGINQMLGITVPILYAATAALVAKGGSIKAVVELAKHYLRGRLAILAAFLVLVQAMATYMAGLGAANTMVTAPLIALAVGFVPHVVAGMAIATATAFTTSPASSETAITAEMSGVEILEHAAKMQPYTIAFFLLGAALAAYGVYKHGSMLRGKDQSEESDAGEPLSALWKRAIPAIGLLVMVVAGGRINNLVGLKVFTPATIVIFTAILTVIFSKLSIDETSKSLVEGGRYILVTLFAVGMFLGFINMIGEIGTFKELAGLAGQVPETFILPVAMIIAFLVAIPAGAFCAGVLALVLPTLATLGMPSVAMGFVAIAAGLGTQISPVQINVAALADGFDTTVMDVIKGNLKFVLGAFVILIIMAVIVV